MPTYNFPPSFVTRPLRWTFAIHCAGESRRWPQDSSCQMAQDVVFTLDSFGYLEQRFIQYAYDNHTIIQHNFWLIHSLTLIHSLHFWCSGYIVPVCCRYRQHLRQGHGSNGQLGLELGGEMSWFHVIVKCQTYCDSPSLFVGFLFE